MPLKKRILHLVLLSALLFITSIDIYAQSNHIDNLKVLYTQTEDPTAKLSTACQLHIDLSFIDSTMAEVYFKEAEDIITQNPSIDQGPYQVSLAYKYFSQKNLTQLRNTLSEKIEEDKLPPVFVAHTDRLKGISLYREKKYRRAKRFFQKSEEVYAELNNKNGIGHAQIGLGNVAKRMKKSNLALEYFSKGITQFEQINDLNSRLLPMNSIALLHLNQGDTIKAQKQYEEILSLLDLSNISHQVYETNIKTKLSSILESQGRIDEANVYKEEVLQYSNDTANQIPSINNPFNGKNGAIIKKQIASTAKDWQAEINALKVKQLETENELKASKIYTQRLLVGIALLLCSLLGFYAYNMRKKNLLIKKQNQVIQTALSEKETLLKEIHHRVKNNLQVVSSLLRIQSNETNDEGAINALKEGQSRVQSMSLIHQSLYQKDNLTGIKMKEYMERLINSLFNTYNISEDDIRLETSIEDINLDIETVVPLGLIINELITNALKYAFEEKQTGVIKVDLREINERLVLIVADDGKGYNPNQQKGDSFGSGLIEAFANKLDGDLTVDSQNGTSITLAIQDYTKI